MDDEVRTAVAAEAEGTGDDRRQQQNQRLYLCMICMETFPWLQQNTSKLPSPQNHQHHQRQATREEGIIDNIVKDRAATTEGQQAEQDEAVVAAATVETDVVTADVEDKEAFTDLQEAKQDEAVAAVVGAETDADTTDKGCFLTGILCPNGHFICKEDASTYLSENVLPQLYKLKETNGLVSCPVDQCGASYCTITLFNQMNLREKLRYLTTIEEICSSRSDVRRIRSALIDVINLRCPTCGIMVDPRPDACSAVLCLGCGNHYCNYCFAAFASGDRNTDKAEAHIHCATHNNNPNQDHRDAFLSQAVIDEGHKSYQTSMLLKFLKLALASPEYGINGGHDVAIALLLSLRELKDIDIDLVALWSTATENKQAQINSISENNRTQNTRGGAMEPSRIGNSKLLLNALVTFNKFAAQQILTSFGEEMDVDYTDPATGHPLLVTAILVDENVVALELLRMGANPFARTTIGRTALYIIIEKGALEVLNYVIANYPDIDCNSIITTEISRYTMVHVAARYNRGSIIRCLLAAYPNLNINAQDNEFAYTPLFLAAVVRSNWSAIELIDAGADVTIKSRVGRTCLFCAIENGNAELVTAILSKQPNLLNEVTEDRTELRPLHVAVLFKQLHILQLLVDMHADINAVTAVHATFYRITPVFLAIFESSCLFAKVLLDAGADFQIPNSDGILPIYLVIERGHTNILHLLLRRGLDINAPVVQGNERLSLVGIAARYRQLEILSILLENGADLAQHRGSESLLTTAVQNDNLMMVKLLIDHGVEYPMLDVSSPSPVHMCIEIGNTSMLRLLMERYSLALDMPVTIVDRLTAIHAACKLGNIDCLCFLIAYSRSIGNLHSIATLLDGLGRTPLQIAEQYNMSQAAQLLHCALNELRKN